MKQPQQIDDKWLKAAVLGTSWAASEIVFGSFLHNLRIPFSGNILTSIGLIILISASYKWKESGLYWRAGLITALLKAVSPSAVIFGPMIAIFTEALLFEISLILLGRNMAGYVLGSVLAMSWVLFQRILNMIIFYGTDLVELYTSLMKMAEKQFHIETDLVWLPIFLLLLVHIIMGLISAFVGIKVGRKLLKNTYIAPENNTSIEALTMNKTSNDFLFSSRWLMINIVLLVSTLLLHVYAPLWVWIVITPLVIIVWSTRYKSALRHLSKPNFWIFFVVITMLASFVFASLQNEPDSLKQGFLTGLQMNFRAALIIVGFSVIGKELYNPKVIDYFRRSSYRQLHLALELSFASVPQVIASLPGVKEFFKNPLSSVSSLLYHADLQIEKLRNENETMRGVFIISGSVGQGKSLFCSRLADLLIAKNVKIGGIISRRIVENDSTIGYDLIEIDTHKEIPFLRLRTDENEAGIGKFTFVGDVVEQGNRIIRRYIGSNSVIFVDEVGRLELKNGGWHDALTEILPGFKGVLVMSVRKDYVEEVIEKYGITRFQIIDIAAITEEDVSLKIKSHL